MIQHVVSRFSFVKRLLAVGALSLVSWVMVNHSLGQAPSSPSPAEVKNSAPEFEAASIKPVKEPNPGRMNDHEEGRRFTTHYTSLSDLILMAYHVDRQQIVGGPTWMRTDEYDVDAVAGEDIKSGEQFEAMLQKLLADRFQLTLHREQREMSVYTLTVAKGGSKLKPADPSGPGNGATCEHLGVCHFRGEPLAHFARWMGFVVLAKPVNDKTGLEGKFDFDLTWTPDESQFAGMGIRVPQAADNPSAPPELFTAIQEQLGLKLEPQKIPAEVLVIDHVERPSEN
jgi:uncharacterized protein (TIGR03435 family)